MSPERFVHPEWLAPIAATWTVAALALAAARRSADRRARRLLGPQAPRRGGRSDAALLAALGLLGAALLGPRIGERLLLVPSRGVDLVLLVDVSRSMDAQDVAPSRLARAQRAGAEILAGLGPDDRAALAAFAGRGVLLTPLTPDRDALAELLAGLGSDLVRPGGSDLGDGVRRSLAAFEAGSERPRALFVLADGEDPARRTELGIADALRAEVRVHAAAIGSEAGAPIPDHGVALRDARGGVVVTRRQAERLERLTAATGGELFVADAWGDIDVAAALAALRAEVASAPGGLAQRRVRAVQVAPLAALAFLLLAGEAALAWRRGPRAGLQLALAAAAIAAALGAAPPLHGRGTGGVEELEARLRERPRDPALLVHLGLARLERGRAEAAARAFAAAALSTGDSQLTALALYDLGVAQLEAGELEHARDAFFDALAIAPSDREARFNLEWTLRALASRPPPPPPAPERGDEREESRTPPPEAAPASPEAPRPGAPPPRDAELLRRWLARVQDDPGRALRSAARETATERRDPGPGW